MTRVLVVDDEIDTLNLLRTILTISGYEAITTLNSTDAITLAEVEHPDCVLLDIMMPTLDGFTLCRMMRLHPLTMNLPIVFVTAYSALDLEERRLEAGADMVLPKPIGMDALVEAVEESMKLHPPRVGATPAAKPAMPAPVQVKPATPAPTPIPAPTPAAQPAPAKPTVAPSPAATTQSAPAVSAPAPTPAQPQNPPAATAAPAQTPAPVSVAASKRTQQTKVVRPSVTPAPASSAPASPASDDDLSFKISPDE